MSHESHSPYAGSLLPALAGAFGDRADAVSVNGKTSSWEELDRSATELAARISGARALAVAAHATLDTLVAVVAGLRAGVPVVPVAPDAGPVERRHILADTGADIAVGFGDAQPAVQRELAPQQELAPGRAKPDAAFILYTSGTTGLPKGVPVTERMIEACLDGLADAWAWGPADKLVHGLPLYHVHGLILGVLGALRTGSRLCHTGRPTPVAYAAAQGTLYFGVPTVWTRLAQDPAAARALRGARLLVSGSAALPATVFDALTGLTGHRPVERYGMTETLITVSARADGARVPAAVGRPLPGVLTRLTHDGELEIKGDSVFGGYLHRTDAPFTADGWFRTGDIATIEPDGVHRIVGRASTDLIKSGGYRIGAGEVEHVLMAHPGVIEAAVVGAPHRDLGQEVVAYVVARQEGLTAEGLITFVAQNLAAHKRPRRVIFVAALPRNALGKVLKQQLK